MTVVRIVCFERRKVWSNWRKCMERLGNWCWRTRVRFVGLEESDILINLPVSVAKQRDYPVTKTHIIRVFSSGMKGISLCRYSPENMYVKFHDNRLRNSDVKYNKRTNKFCFTFIILLKIVYYLKRGSLFSKYVYILTTTSSAIKWRIMCVT